MYAANYYIETAAYVKTRSAFAIACALSKVSTSRIREMAFSRTGIDVANDIRK